jgi:hypothetical protein
MLTRKQYRTIKQIKPYIITTIAIGTILIANTILNNQAKAQLQQEAEAYKQCIIQQSETQGYIIRSACSTNYKQLDQIANLKYIQIKLDLYLEQ